MSTRRSLFFSFIDRYASLAIGILSSMIIARLLTPTEIGIFSVAMVLIALVSTVRDMGAGQYLVQEKELTDDRIRAVWAVQLGLGVLLAAVVLGLSRPAAVFYGEPRVEAIMQVLALNYLINPLGSVTYAWLMREMRYDAVAIVRFSSTLGGAGVSVWLALRGHGAISLAWGSLAGTVFNAGVSVFFRPRHYPWMPGLREVPRVLSFGSKVTSASIASTVTSGAPEFVLGKLQSLTAAGFFSRAQGLVLMFNRLITDAVYPVALSLFSKEMREGNDASAAFVKAHSVMSALSWSFALMLAFLSHPLINLLYGNQWNDAVDLARILSLAMAFGAGVPLCRAALLAAGAAGQTLSTTLATVAVTLPLVAAGAVAGMLHLGIGLLVSAVVTSLLWLSAARKVMRFDWLELGTELGRSFAVAVVSAIGPACALLVWGPRPDHVALPLTVGVVGSSVGFLLGVYALRHPLRSELRRIAPFLTTFLKQGRD